MPLLPKNLRNLRDLREKNSPFLGDKQKFLVSFNFPVVALVEKFRVPARRAHGNTFLFLQFCLCNWHFDFDFLAVINARQAKAEEF